ITGAAIVGRAEDGRIVRRPAPMAKVMVSVPGTALALRRACRSEPGPLSLVLTTWVLRWPTTTQGSRPWLPSLALRYSVFPIADRLDGSEGPLGLMETSVTVVPSYCHSWVLSLTVKYRKLPTGVR